MTVEVAPQPIQEAQRRLTNTKIKVCTTKNTHKPGNYYSLLDQITQSWRHGNSRNHPEVCDQTFLQSQGGSLDHEGLEESGSELSHRGEAGAELSHEQQEKKVNGATCGESAAKVDPAASLLLCLPIELRLEIWRYVFSPPINKPRLALSLLRSNSQIYEEAFPIAFPKVRFYFRNTKRMKTYLDKLPPGQRAHFSHVRMPARSLNVAMYDILAVPIHADLQLKTVTVTLKLPPDASGWQRKVPSPTSLQQWVARLNKLTGVNSIVIDNNGFYGDWDFILLFVQMHDVDPGVSLRENFTVCYGVWTYSLQQKKTHKSGGYYILMSKGG